MKASNADGSPASRGRGRPGPRQFQHVLLVMEQDAGYHGGVLRGVIAYAKTRPRWSTHLHTPVYADPLGAIEDLRPDGVVIDLTDHRWADALKRLRIPAVNVGCREEVELLPRVGAEDVLAGRMAADYLVERGFHHFAFYGYSVRGYSRDREQGFRARLAQHGFDCTTLDATRAVHRIPEDRERRWLRTLPKPVALFAATDQHGLAISQACQQTGMRIPDDVTILSMDNNELICHLAHKPLSSVVTPAEQIGYAAARLLDRMMRGGKVHPQQTILIKPPTIITRQSTDLTAVEDPIVAEAVRYIRANASRSIGVEDVLTEVTVSRRTLERRFLRHLGRSPLDEIRRAHVALAQDLLAQTDLPTTTVAARSGLRTASNLAMIFRRETGLSPSMFRERTRRAQTRLPPLS